MMPCILYILTYLLISVSESDSLIVLYNANRMYGTFLVNSSCHGIVMNIETKVGVTEKNVPANPYSSSLAGIVVEPSNYVPVSKTYQNRSTRKDTGAKKKKKQRRVQCKFAFLLTLPLVHDLAESCIKLIV